MGFSSNINNNLTKKGEYNGVKTHDWNTFMKVIMWVIYYIFIYWYTFLLYFILVIFETNNDSFVWL